MESTIFIGKNLLITSNIKSSEKTTCVGSSFLNLFEVEKNFEIVDEET
jgi:hypothetical protein